jgi:hypothetical protein
MFKRSMGTAWKVVLTLIALIAMAMAFYVQFFEERSRREEDQLAVARLEAALAESRARLEAEILAQLRADLARGGPSESGDQPLPNAVLRRGESDGRVLEQVLDSRGSQGAARQAGYLALARQMEQSDQALRRDINDLRAEVTRERDISGKTLRLLLIALIPVVAHLLFMLWTQGDATVRQV